MRSELHEYQKYMVRFALYRQFTMGFKGSGWFCDPGLGKTISHLQFLEYMFGFNEFRRVLIIAPRRVCRMVWPREVKKWQFPFKVNNLCGLSRDKIYNSLRTEHAHIDIINPESVHKLTDIYGYWDSVCVDESTKFKNWAGVKSKSKATVRNVPRRGGRMVALRRMLFNGIPKRTILTGSPAASSLADLFAQIFILDDGQALGTNKNMFKHRFMVQGRDRRWHFRPEMIPFMRELIQPMVIYLDAESYLDMPELVINDMWCQLPPRARTRYQRLKEELYAELTSGDILAMNSASARIKCRQFANGAVFDQARNVHHAHDEKLDMLCDLIEELQGKRLLVFYQFDHDRQRILKKFPKAGVLRGGTSDEESERLCDAWNQDELPLFLIQSQAAEHGLNLQEGSCHHIAMFGMCEIPEVVDQGMRRVYRQGNTNSHVFVHRLLTEDTVDGTIADRIDGKFQTQAEFLEALKEHARS